MKQEQNKLTPRQWATYQLIKDNTLNGIWTTKEQIVNNYSFDKENRLDGYLKHETSHDLCAGVWKDINEINLSTELDKIIITDKKNNYKLAETIEEANEYRLSFYNKALKALMRYANISRKIKSDGQGKLISNQLRPIDEESQTREFIETFLKGE